MVQEPISIVVVSLLSLSLVSFLIFILKFIFKKNINPLLIVISFSIPPIISILRPGVYESGDFTLHIYRVISFFQNLQFLNLSPSWGYKLNGGFGYPLFIFINPIPYYLISIFHFLGLSFIWSMKSYLIFSYIFSGFTMYLFSKKALRNDLAAVTSAIFYLFTPYHLIDLHFRVDIGEILAFAIFPLLCLFFLNALENKKISNYIILGIIWGLFILTHQAIAILSLIFFGIFVLFGLVNLGIKAIKENYKIIFSFLIGLLISSYSWSSYLTYSQYTIVKKIAFDINLFNISDLLFTKWRMGFLFQGPHGELGHIIGYTQTIICIYFLYLVFSKKIKKNKKTIIFLTSSVIFLTFMITPYSYFIWQIIPMIKNVLLSYRLLLFIGFSTSVLAGLLTLEIKSKKIIYLLISITILYTILNWGNRRVIPQINDSYLISNLASSTLGGEGLGGLGNPKWAGDEIKWMNMPSTKMEVIKGDGITTKIYESPTSNMYLINANTNLTLSENTWYFPGWKAYVNNKKIKIDPNYQEKPGNINIKVQKGLSKLEIKYEDLFYLKVLKIISFSSLIFFSLLYLKTRKLN